MKEEYYAKKKPCHVFMLILSKKVKRKENNISQFVEVYKNIVLFSLFRKVTKTIYKPALVSLDSVHLYVPVYSKSLSAMNSSDSLGPRLP